ncbi:MAG: hypothetical protein DHS20C17_32340 [Cyclobacteriaceae bacterium]|nr:MAG: hypothetical protein DHS20C17_32340 [Cyclobacteriaceae bacterium]
MTEKNKENLDGCDVEINEEDATADEELPPAAGGVDVEQKNEH